VFRLRGEREGFAAVQRAGRRRRSRVCGSLYTFLYSCYDQGMSDSFQNWLAEALAARGWSRREAARHAGISHTSVADVLGGRTRPTANFCMAMAGALGVPREDVLRRAGLLPPPGEDSLSLRELWSLLLGMTPSQLREIRHFAIGIANGAPSSPLESEASAQSPAAATRH